MEEMEEFVISIKILKGFVMPIISKDCTLLVIEYLADITELMSLYIRSEYLYDNGPIISDKYSELMYNGNTNISINIYTIFQMWSGIKFKLLDMSDIPDLSKYIPDMCYKINIDFMEDYCYKAELRIINKKKNDVLDNKFVILIFKEYVKKKMLAKKDKETKIKFNKKIPVEHNCCYSKTLNISNKTNKRHNKRHNKQFR